MIGTFASVSPELLVFSTIVIGIFLLAALVAMVFMYNHFHQILVQQEETISGLHSDLNAICSGAVGIGEHLAKLDERMLTVSQRLDELENQETPERSYKYAIKLIRNGAKLDQIMADCGISRGEAELLMLNKSIDQFNNQAKN